MRVDLSLQSVEHGGTFLPVFFDNLIQQQIFPLNQRCKTVTKHLKLRVVINRKPLCLKGSGILDGADQIRQGNYRLGDFAGKQIQNTDQ